MSSFYKCKSYSHFFNKNISIYVIFNDQSFNDMLTNNIFSYEQLGPDVPENSLTTAAEAVLLSVLALSFSSVLLFYKVVTLLLS